MTLTLSNKRVLVTGGAGFIGSHLIDRIAADAPAHLVAVDNLFLGRQENLTSAWQMFPNLQFIEEDAADFEAMRRILDEHAIDVVFNLAAIPLPTSLERPRWTIQVNTDIALTAVECLREGLYQTLIHFSSSEAYGTAKYVPMSEDHPSEPMTPYAASKLAEDHTVLSYHRTFGLDVAIVRPFNNFGPRQNDKAYAGVIPVVMKRALNKEPILITGNGEQTRDFIFVTDVADAAVRVYQEPDTRGEVVNIGTGKETSINELVRTILAVLGSDAPIEYIAERLGDVRQHCADIAKAQALIQFEPRTSLQEGLARTAEWYQSQIGEQTG